MVFLQISVLEKYYDFFIDLWFEELCELSENLENHETLIILKNFFFF